MAATAPAELTSVDAVTLRRFLDGPNRVVREHVRAVLARPEFERPVTPPPTERYREQVMEWGRLLARTNGPSLLFPREFGGLERVGAAITAFETLGHSDLSLLVKCGVQFGLFGGAVHHLGTRKHHERYLRRHRLVRARRGVRDERDRPRLERPGGRDHRDLGPRAADASSSTARPRAPRRTTSATPHATAGSRPSSASSSWAARRAAFTRSSCRSAEDGRHARGWRGDRGLRREARAERRGQRTASLPPACGWVATPCSTATGR